VSKKSILIAENEAVVSLDLKMLLRHHDYVVTSTVSTGEDLITEYKLKNPDLIIADLKLNGKVSGLKAIKEIRKMDNTPIIIISGFFKTRLKGIADSITNSEILEKPFEQSDLLYLANKLSKSNLKKPALFLEST
jgi:DNA-binding response OmpR family regulator